MGNFRVVPSVSVRGFCPTVCETLQDAIDQQFYLNLQTDFYWVIEAMNEQAEQELSEYQAKHVCSDFTEQENDDEDFTRFGFFSSSFYLFVLIYKHKQGSVMEHEICEKFTSLTSLFEFLSKIRFDLEYYYVCKVLDSNYGSSCL